MYGIWGKRKAGTNGQREDKKSGRGRGG